MLSLSWLDAYLFGQQHRYSFTFHPEVPSPLFESPIRTIFVAGCLALPLLSGCVDGPLFELKKVNPWIRNQWKKDRERGVVFSQRVDEIRLVKSQLARMSPEEQAKWVGLLNDMADNETSPELRREAVLALKSVVERPDATNAVIRFSNDKNDKVRLAVTHLLKETSSPESTATLLKMAKGDASTSVRLAATQSLGSHRTDEVKQFLAQQIDDRSPAVQYHASLALKDYTGKDFGDVGLWRRYLAGEPVEPKTPTIAESIESMLPLRR